MSLCLSQLLWPRVEIYLLDSIWVIWGAAQPSEARLEGSGLPEEEQAGSEGEGVGAEQARTRSPPSDGVSRRCGVCGPRASASCPVPLGRAAHGRAALRTRGSRPSALRSFRSRCGRCGQQVRCPVRPWAGHLGGPPGRATRAGHLGLSWLLASPSLSSEDQGAVSCRTSHPVLPVTLSRPFTSQSLSFPLRDIRNVEPTSAFTCQPCERRR